MSDRSEPIPTSQNLLAPGVVGRERELGQLAAFVADIPRGCHVAVVEGDAGAGKTTLARATEALARGHGVAMLGCAGSEFETELSYAALGDLLGPVLESGLGALPPPQRRALEVALAICDPEEAPPDQRAVAVATLGLLTERTGYGPVLLVVDDVQWVDGSSARILAFVVRRLGTAPLGLLMTRRASGPVPLGVSRALEPGRVRVLSVCPMPRDAIGRLIKLRLGAGLSRARLREIHDASQGNPFYALELARALHRRPGTEDGPLAVPSSLRELVAARLASVGGRSRPALLLVAAMARPDLAILRGAAPEIDVHLEEAASAGLVDTDGSVVRFTHPLLALAVYEDAAPSERRAAHSALAALTEGEERARHLALATLEPDEPVALALENAARGARARAAPEAAARFAADAARLTPRPLLSRGLARRLEAGRCYAAAGDLDGARRELDAVIGTADAGVMRATALHERARAAWGAENYLKHVAMLTRALADVGGEPDLEIAIRVDLATALLQAGSLHDAQDQARRALALTARSGTAAILSAALTTAVVADFLLGDGIRHELLDRASGLSVVDSGTAMAPGFLRVLLLKWTDRLTEARAALVELKERAEAEQDDQHLGFVVVQLGELCCWLGDMDAARECARLAQTVTVHGGQDDTLALFLEGLTSANAGDVRMARAATLAAARIAESSANHRFHIRCLAVLGLIELSVGDPRAAASPLRLAEEMSTAAGYAEPGVLRFEHDAAEALLAVGDHAGAERICAHLEECVRRHGRPWVTAAAGRCRALLRSEAGDLDGAERGLDVALAGFRDLRQPLEVGRTLLLLGGVRRRRRQKRSARDALAAAEATFSAVGATAWAERACDEARRIGGRPPAPGGLTDTERRVALLATGGSTNREIAGELFVSVKTVERHLSHVFLKLGVSSRRDLRVALGGECIASKTRDRSRFPTTPCDLASTSTDDASFSPRSPTPPT